MRYHDIQITGSLNISGSITIPAGGSNIKPTSPPTGSIFLEVSDSGSNLVVFNGSGSTGYQQVGLQTTPIAPDPPDTTPTVEYLVVAGGGGSAYDSGGGAGAGGLLSSSIADVTSGSVMTITVGAGGGVQSDGTNSSLASTSGTSFTTITSTGGGQGAGAPNQGAGYVAGDGGSGGGGSGGSYNNPGGSGIVGQGHDGGNSGTSGGGATYPGAGGGGAGEAGQSSANSGGSGKNGGIGKQSSITGTATYYAGGGGGGVGGGASAGVGGTGGGGNGGSSTQGTPGTANTGGGAGGSSTTAGVAGGSGVVILSYPTGSGTARGGIITTRSDGNFVHTFKESGTFTVGDTSFMTVAPTENFNILTWSGDNSNDRDLTGLGFQPDWVWIKRRNSSEPHAIYDVLRGVNKQLSSDSDLAQATNAGSYLGMSSFDSDGFNVGNNGGTNRSGNTYVGWCWKAGGAGVSNSDGNITSTVSVNQAAGFSIVKYTGNNSATMTVGHGLSQAPQLVITKRTDADQQWGVYTNAITGDGTTNWFSLDDADAAGSGNFLSVTNQVLSATQTGGFWMQGEQIAYCFHDIAGYQKIGTYTGTNSSNTINVGFKPKFLLIKGNTNSTNWTIVDNQRDNADEWLYANAADGTYDDGNTYTAFTTNGFTVDTTASYVNSSGVTYIYLAISE